MAHDYVDGEHTHVQHGIDNNPEHDPEKGAAIGGIGGLAVGAAAGSMMGLGGAVIGGIVGAIAGAAGSGAAVAAVDQIDDDDTVTGLHHDHTAEAFDNYDEDTAYDTATPVGTAATAYPYGTNAGVASDAGADLGASYDRGTSYTGGAGMSSGSMADGSTGYGTSSDSMSGAYGTGTGLGNDVPGVQTGGHAVDGTPDTRGISEKVADAVTGDHIDDKTGKVV